MCGRDDQQGAVAGKFLQENFADRKIAFVHDKTAYGKGLADATMAVYEAAGGKPALYEAYTAGEKDYTALVSKLKSEGIGVLYVGGYHTEAGLMARQMKEQGMDTVLVSGDALVTDEYWAITGDAGEGTLLTFSPDPRKNPDAAQLVEEFRAKGVEPEGYVLYTYAAVQAWKDAVEAAKSTEFDAVVEALNAGTFKTVLGPGSDGYHEDHFHLDLARHDATGRAYCRPIIKDSPAPPIQYHQQPHYYPPEVAQNPQPQYYPPEPYGHHPPQHAYPQQDPYVYPPQQGAPVQPGHDPYALNVPMSYAAEPRWPVARVPTPYTSSLEDALDR